MLQPYLQVNHGSLLHIDGLKISFEVGREHETEKAWQETRDSYKYSDVLIVVCADVRIENRPNLVKPKGFIYMSSGDGRSAMCRRRYTVKLDPEVLCRNCKSPAALA